MKGGELVQELSKDVCSAAASVAREWPGIIEADDVEQEIWMKIIPSSSYLESLEALDEHARKRALRVMGHRVASDYRSSYELFSGNCFYGSGDVRRILGEQINPADEQAVENFDYAAPSDTPGSETHSEQMDLRAGIALLFEKNEFLGKIIMGQYFYRKPHHTYREQLKRAVDALTRCMNGHHKTRIAQYTEQTGLRSSDEHSDPMGTYR